MILCDKKGRILFTSELLPGSNVDFTLFKKELAHLDFGTKQVWVDLGFVGIKNYIKEQHVNIPHKKPRNKLLTQEQKDENTALSRIRVIVENAIAGLKRYYILRHENRIKLRNKLSEAVELCAALWNFKRGFTTQTAWF